MVDDRGRRSADAIAQAAVSGDHDNYRERLTAARERLGLTRREMAKRLLTPRATYEQWEYGKRRTPGVAIVAAESLHRRRPSGELFRDVLSLADGTLTALEIAARLEINKNYIYTILRKLRSKGKQPAILPGKRGPAPGQTLAPRNFARDQEIAKSITDGETFLAIASRLHISHQRVAQIAKRLGIQSARASKQARSLERLAAKAAERKAKQEREEKMFREMYRLVESGMSIRKAGSSLGLRVSQRERARRKMQLGSITQHGRWRKKDRPS